MSAKVYEDFWKKVIRKAELSLDYVCGIEFLGTGVGLNLKNNLVVRLELESSFLFEDSYTSMIINIINPQKGMLDTIQIDFDELFGGKARLDISEKDYMWMIGGFFSDYKTTDKDANDLIGEVVYNCCRLYGHSY